MKKMKQSTDICLIVRPSCFRNMGKEYLDLRARLQLSIKKPFKKNYAIDSMCLYFEKNVILSNL